MVHMGLEVNNQCDELMFRIQFKNRFERSRINTKRFRFGAINLKLYTTFQKSIYLQASWTVFNEHCAPWKFVLGFPSYFFASQAVNSVPKLCTYNLDNSWKPWLVLNKYIMLLGSKHRMWGHRNLRDQDITSRNLRDLDILKKSCSLQFMLSHPYPHTVFLCNNNFG